MCTATWMAGDRFRYFLFNRDEKRTRSGEKPPRLFEPRGLPRFLAPEDPESGGSWIAVNEYGLTASVLNYYEAGDPRTIPPCRERTSRGTLPLRAAAHLSPAEAAAEVAAILPSGIFEPFFLFLQSGEGTGELLTWNGQELLRKNLDEFSPPLTTSSWNSAAVTAFRKGLYRELVPGPPRLPGLLEFHGTNLPDQPAYGPAMIRDDAHTRSLTLVRIGPGDISMRHQLFDPRSATFGPPSEIGILRRFSQ